MNLSEPGVGKCGLPVENVAAGNDLPVSWHLAVILVIVHAASGELFSGRIAESEVEPAMFSTVMTAIGQRSA